jgi:phosphatidylinositol-3-phosphatase
MSRFLTTTRAFVWICALVGALAGCNSGGTGSSPTTPPEQPPTPPGQPPPPADSTETPHLDHVVVIVLENKSYDEVSTQPYVSALIRRGAVFTRSFAVADNSQPNYLALWAGSTLGVASNSCPPPGSPFAVENLGHACEAAGLTWRAYSENLPAAGDAVCAADADLYTRKHDPWTNFSNLDHSNERPYADLAADIARGHLPRLALVVPNNCNNSHDCSAAVSDAWLAANVPAILGALGPNGVLVLTWDEGNSGSSNHILTVFVGEPVQAGYVSNVEINHYTVLRAICEALGLVPFGTAAHQASIVGIWAGVPAEAPGLE